MSKRFFGISSYFKENYGKKYVKLSLDGGFTCPNRDGKISRKGCIFCSETGSGEFAGDLSGDSSISFERQIQAQKELLSDKWREVHYLAYLQNFSNSYAQASTLRTIYNAAWNQPEVEGLIVGTRPDCIDDSVVEVFKEQKQKGIFWVELGLQTIHETTALWMNRGYSLETFKAVYNKLQRAEIPVVVHLIVGFPNETQKEFLQTIEYMNQIKPFGVKFHMLNVLEGTQLGNLYKKSPFSLLDEATYIQWITTAIACLNPEIVIHRVTGDGSKSLLIEPRWILNKRSVLNGIEKSLKENKISQGCWLNKIASVLDGVIHGNN